MPPLEPCPVRVPPRGMRGRGPLRRGSAVVEFALIAPLFIMIIVGMIEIGRAMMVREILTNASREGARVAGNNAVQLTSTIKDAVDNYLAGNAITGAETTVSPDPPSSVQDGQSITVTVSVSYAQVKWGRSPWFLSSKTLSASSTMIRQPAP